MPLGDSHRAFAEAAARDGIELLVEEAFPWLTETGHIALEELAEEPPDGAEISRVEVIVRIRQEARSSAALL